MVIASTGYGCYCTDQAAFGATPRQAAATCGPDQGTVSRFTHPAGAAASGYARKRKRELKMQAAANMRKMEYCPKGMIACGVSEKETDGYEVSASCILRG